MNATYVLEEREINTILTALAKMPYQEVFILIAKLQNEFNEQNKEELLKAEEKKGKK